MSLDGINVNRPYATAYVPVKAEQNCGNCLLSLCHKICACVSCLFKTLFCCFCSAESSHNKPSPSPTPQPATPPLSPAPIVSPPVPLTTTSISTNSQRTRNDKLVSAYKSPCFTFPRELFMKILSFCELRDVVRFSSCSRTIYQFRLADDEILYRDLHIQKFSLEMPSENIWRELWRHSEPVLYFQITQEILEKKVQAITKTRLLLIQKPPVKGDLMDLPIQVLKRIFLSCDNRGLKALNCVSWHMLCLKHASSQIKLINMTWKQFHQNTIDIFQCLDTTKSKNKLKFSISGEACFHVELNLDKAKIRHLKKLAYLEKSDLTDVETCIFDYRKKECADDDKVSVCCGIYQRFSISIKESEHTNTTLI